MKLKILLKKMSVTALSLFAIVNVNAQTLDVSNDADIITWYIIENEEYGQSFTAGLTGYLSQVDIHLQADGAFPLVSGDFEITIREGDGDQGDILGVETFSIIGDEATGFFSIDMPLDSIYLFSENTYTYFIHRTSATGRLVLNASADVGIGKLYYYDGEGELQEEAWDFKFQTYVNETPQPNAEILFGDYFPNVQKWDIQSGELNYDNYIATTEGNNDMTIAFADFTRPLEAGEILELNFKSNEVTNFATNGWAGLSLFTDGSGGTEEIFIGSIGDESSWGIDGGQFADAIALTQTSPLVNVRFKYTFDSGDWMLDVAGETISGTIDASLAFNSIRIGADANNTANIAVSKLAVFTSAFLEENSYVHGDLTLCESGTTTIGVDLTYPELYYSLVDEQNELIDGKVEGNWSEITFETETITNTKKYNVSATKDYGVRFPNNNEYLRIDNPFYEYDKELTVEAWVNSSDGKFWSGQSPYNIDNINNTTWIWESSDAFNFYISDGGTWKNVLAPPLPNKWTHVATVANETGLYVYYDGVLVVFTNDQKVQVGLVAYDQSIISFGHDPRFPNNTDRSTSGSIDEIKIWNTTRTEEEIQLDMNGYDENDDNLVHYIPFGEGMGNMFADFKKADAEAYIVNPSGNTWVNGAGINITSLLNSKLDPAVTVEIEEPVQVDVLDNVNLCNNEFTLPALTVGDYFTETNGGGDQLNADDVISATQTLYIFADNGTCTDESSFEINIYSALDATISQDELTLTADQDNVSYQWLDCNNDNSPISGETNQSLTVTENGSYAVEVTLEGCSEISDCIIIDYLSIDKNEFPTITLFPNPNNGKFTVDFGSLSNVNLTIRDVTGKIVYNASNIMSNTYDVMLDNNKGVYLVEISSESTHQVLRVVKQ